MIDRQEIETLLRSNPSAARMRCEDILQDSAISAKDKIFARIRLSRSLTLLGAVREGSAMADLAYTEARDLDEPRLTILASSECGVQAYFREEFLQSLRWHESALQLAESVELLPGETARLYVNMANTLTRLNANVEAIELYSKALDVARSIGDQQLMAMLLSNLTVVMRVTSVTPDVQKSYLDEALSIFRSLGDTVGEENTLMSLAIWYRTMGEPERAKAIYRDCVFAHRRNNTRVPQEILFHLVITCYVLKQADEARSWFNELQKDVDERVGWEVEVEVAICSGMVAHLEGRLNDCIERYEKAYQLYINHNHQSQAEDVLVQLLERLEEAGDDQRVCQCFHRLKEVRAQTRAQESQQSLAVLAANHERESTRQTAELDRIRNVELVKAHEDLVRSSFVLDRLVENCAVRLSMPLDLIRDVLTTRRGESISKVELEDVQSVVEVMLANVADILQKGSQEPGQASLQTLAGVVEFVKDEVHARLAAKSWSSVWNVDIRSSEVESVHAARFHSMFMRILDLFQSVLIGSASLELNISTSSTSSVEITVAGRGTLTIDPVSVDAVIGAKKRVDALALRTLRSLRMTWLGVEYAVERLGSTDVEARCQFGRLDVRLTIPMDVPESNVWPEPRATLG